MADYTIQISRELLQAAWKAAYYDGDTKNHHELYNLYCEAKQPESIEVTTQQLETIEELIGDEEFKKEFKKAAITVHVLAASMTAHMLGDMEAHKRLENLYAESQTTEIFVKPSEFEEIRFLTDENGHALHLSYAQ